MDTFYVNTVLSTESHSEIYFGRIFWGLSQVKTNSKRPKKFRAHAKDIPRPATSRPKNKPTTAPVALGDGDDDEE